MNYFRKFEKPAGDFLLLLHKLFIPPQSIPAIDHKSIRNILVVIRHQMGDFLCASPMVRSLRNFYPQAKITLVTKSSTNYDQVFRFDKSFVDEVFYYEYGIESYFNLIRDLRLISFDIAVVPSTVVFSATNHLISFYSKAKIRVGVRSMNYDDNKAAYMLNVKNDFLWISKKIHQIERNLDVIRQINIEPLEKKIRINLTDETLLYAERYFSLNYPDKNRPVIGFHPGAGKPSNIWPAENFAALAQKLSSTFNADIFISEGPSDKEYVDKMIYELRTRYNINNFSRHKGALMNNLAIISKLKLFVTNDTGIMHLASGVNKLNIVAIFGPTNAYEWGPIGENCYSIQSPFSELNKLKLEKVLEVCETVLAKKS